MQWRKNAHFSFSLQLHHNLIFVDSFAKKSSHFSKMDILFLSFFSKRAHFFFRFLLFVGYKIVGTYSRTMFGFE